MCWFVFCLWFQHYIYTHFFHHPSTAIPPNHPNLLPGQRMRWFDIHCLSYELSCLCAPKGIHIIVSYQELRRGEYHTCIVLVQYMSMKWMNKEWLERSSNLELVDHLSSRVLRTYNSLQPPVPALPVFSHPPVPPELQLSVVWSFVSTFHINELWEVQINLKLPRSHILEHVVAMTCSVRGKQGGTSFLSVESSPRHQISDMLRYRHNVKL